MSDGIEVDVENDLYQLATLILEIINKDIGIDSE